MIVSHHSMELLQAGVSRVGFTLFLVTFSLMRLVTGHLRIIEISLFNMNNNDINYQFYPFPSSPFHPPGLVLVIGQSSMHCNGHPPSIIKFLTSSIGIGIGAAITELTDSATEVNSVF